MNVRHIGEEIERIVKTSKGLDEDERGFDASHKGTPIEIKGCIPIHRNGVTSNGKDRVTKGRFWIANHAHRHLLKERGMYIFVLYNLLNNEVNILKLCARTVFNVDLMITGGKNTKIRYDRIFLNAKHGATVWA